MNDVAKVLFNFFSLAPKLIFQDQNYLGTLNVRGSMVSGRVKIAETQYNTWLLPDIDYRGLLRVLFILLVKQIL